MCEYHALDPVAPLGGPGAVVTELVEGATVWRQCIDGVGTIATELVTVGARDPRATALLAVERAVAALDVDLPIADSSPANHVTVPNIATWFWMTNTAPQAATASVGGVAATVRSQLRTVTFDAGDQSVACPDGGHPYDLAQPDDRQTSSCVIRFVPPARHIDVDVTATWHLTWTATNGETGDLGDVDRTSTIPLDVHELHTVIRNQ